MLMTETTLLLAAGGRSSRMGHAKHLLDFRGGPWLRWQLERFRAAGGARALVVLPGSPTDEDRAALVGIELEIGLIEQPDPALPMSRSLRLAAHRACETSTAGAWWLPVDTPAPTTELWQDLLAALRNQPQALAAAPAAGGHPVLQSRPLLEMLAADPSSNGLRLDETLHGLERSGRLAHGRRVDELCRLNLNTPESWRDWLTRADDLLEERHARA